MSDGHVVAVRRPHRALIVALLLLLVTGMSASSAATASSPTSAAARDASPTTWATEAIASGHFDEITVLEYSPDGAWLASGSEDERMLVWNTSTWEVVASFDCSVCWSVADVSWSPDSTLLVTTSQRGGMEVFEVGTWEHRARGVGSEPRLTEFSVDGSQLIGIGGASGGITLWNTSTWAVEGTASASVASAFTSSLSPDGSELVVGLTNGTLAVLDTSSWSETLVTSNHSAQVTGVDHAADGLRVVTSSFSGELILWNTSDWSQVHEADVGFSAVHGAAWTPNGTHVAVAWGVWMGLWDAAVWIEPSHLYNGVLTQTRAVAVSPDGSEVLLGGDDGDHLMRRYAAADGSELATPQAHGAIVRAIAVQAVGGHVATGDEDGRVVLSDAVTLQQVRAWSLGSEIGDLEFAPDGAHLYALTAAGKVVVLEVATGATITNLSTGFTDVGGGGVDVSPDGTMVAAANLRSTEVRVWDTSDWSLDQQLTGLDWARSVAFSPDGALLLASQGSSSSQGGTGTAHAWSTSTWTEVSSFGTYGSTVYIHPSADGSQVYVSSADGEWWDPTSYTEVWNVSDWSLAANWSGVEEVLDAAPDGTQILNAECAASIVSTTDGSSIERCMGSTAVFSADGTEVFGAAFPGVLQRFGADSDEDGVADLLDQCAATQRQVAVGEDGCVLSDADSDNDGVLDVDDQCPATPSLESVDAAGCSSSQRDTDGDGVTDINDDCPATVAGTTVDADGCAVATAPDADGDGVPDAEDACPGTAAGVTVNATGCVPLVEPDDADGDGVTDAMDQCAGTAAGAAVNADGCAAAQLDSDGDGVSDDVDACAATPAGSVVNAVGCVDATSSGMDTDGDGVNDTNDACPDTLAGFAVDEHGCVIASSGGERGSDSSGLPWIGVTAVPGMLVLAAAVAGRRD